ncbi:unnamed protein product [Blepharisma stoltei]|uniref:Uncharacterized protein n=1 Tax=Blepharisma stoltei TaxID=1481888 RepID=A0AAU9IKQ5_9CILI|nr:unnamed protein product [Blepharisma stoltei]
MKGPTLLSIAYSAATFSTFYIFFTYPIAWINYAERPEYEVVNYTNYSTVIAEESGNFTCTLYMDYKDAEDRMKFANDINTWYVLGFAFCDYILMVTCAIGSIVYWYYVIKDPNDKQNLKRHIVVELLALVSLLIISPLSYPALIDDYKMCMDDNLLMRYGYFMIIQMMFFVSLCGGALLYLLIFNQHVMKSRLGEKPVICLLGLAKFLSGALSIGFLLLSALIVYHSNTKIALLVILCDEGVGLITLIYDVWKHNLISEIQPIIGPKAVKSSS